MSHSKPKQHTDLNLATVALGKSAQGIRNLSRNLDFTLIDAIRQPSLPCAHQEFVHLQM